LVNQYIEAGFRLHKELEGVQIEAADYLEVRTFFQCRLCKIYNEIF
jgi:hypothetical protein